MGFRKKFVITGDDEYVLVTGSKQRVNLSGSASLIVQSDIKAFSNDASSGDKGKVAGFFNQIFRNFYQDADATFSHRFINKYDELVAMFSTPEFELIDEKTKRIFIDKILAVYQKELIEKSQNYDKLQGFYQ